MSSKLGDAALQAVVFDLTSRQSKGGKKTEIQVRKWRTKICGLFSLLHGMGLAELAEGDALNMPVLTGLCVADVEVLLGQQGVELTADRTFAVLMWVCQELTQAMTEGHMNVPAPIMSRMYQEISIGMLAFNNAMKIHDTPFPFPYAQIISTLMMFLTLTIGIVINMYMRVEGEFQPYLPMAMSFICTCGYYAVNEVQPRTDASQSRSTCTTAVPPMYHRCTTMLYHRCTTAVPLCCTSAVPRYNPGS